MRRKKGTGSVWVNARGTWEGHIAVGADEVTGKRIYRYATGATAEECLDKLAKAREEFLRASSRPMSEASPALTLRAFCEQYWLPSTRLGVSDRSYDRIVLDASYVTRYLGQTPLGEITHARILRFTALMQIDGLSDYQQYKGVRSLKRMLAFAGKMGLLLRSPAGDFPLPRYRQREIHPLSPEQIDRLLGTSWEDRLLALYVVALDTGARQGELFALEWSDWNPERSELSITKSVSDRKGILEVKEPKTRAGKRTVIVSAETRIALEAHQGRMGAEKEYHQSRLIFPNVDGQYLRCSNFHRDSWQPALKRAGLEGFRFHDLRHTTATLLLMEGDNIRSIADRLGHADASLILRTYGHVTPQMRKDSGELLGKFLKNSATDLPSAESGV